LIAILDQIVIVVLKEFGEPRHPRVNLFPAYCGSVFEMLLSQGESVPRHEPVHEARCAIEIGRIL
jgi:hypothetical protein